MLDFPNSPAPGDVFGAYTWDGEKWTATGGGSTGAVRYDAAQTLTAAQQDQAKSNIAIVGRNKIINGGFVVNQRVYGSSTALAATKYGHDRWKAGASGGDYNFTQLATATLITIAANKSLIQVVKAASIEGGTYTLSWLGTSVARIGINSATPSGNFAASPITISGQTVGTTMSVEFTGANAVGGSALATNSGTLSSVQLELGTKSSPFEVRSFEAVLADCLPYYEKSYDYGTAAGSAVTVGYEWIFSSSVATQAGKSVGYAAPKQVSPTLIFYSPNSGASGNAYDYQVTADVATNTNSNGRHGFAFYVTKTSAATNVGAHWTSEAEL